MAKRTSRRYPTLKNTLTTSRLLKVKADKLKLLFKKIFKRAKYANKMQAVERIIKRAARMRVSDRNKLSRSVTSHLAYYAKKKAAKKVVAPVDKIAKLIAGKSIEFVFSRETEHYIYYRTGWVIPEGYEDIFWEVYGEVTQDFVEKNKGATFIGFKYAVYRNVGERLVELTDDLYVYSPHFDYKDFFEPEDMPVVPHWYNTLFRLSMQARLRRYFEDEFTIHAYYIVVKKEDFEQ